MTNAQVPVQVTRLSKSFGRERVVDDVSFQIERGSILALVGGNGSGKSTVLRLMLGLYGGAGEARFFGQRYAELAIPGRVVGAVLDTGRFDPRMTARHLLLAVGKSIGVPESRCLTSLDSVGLTTDLNCPIGSFSLGMIQRLRLACATPAKPPVLILDEPTNGLDPGAIGRLREMLRLHAEAGGCALVATHAIAEIVDFCDQVIVLGQGRRFRQGSVADLSAQSAEARFAVRADCPALLTDALVGTQGTVWR